MSREDDAKRDLARIEREREKLLFDSGTSDDDNDPVVKLGKRIARVLGFDLEAPVDLALRAVGLVGRDFGVHQQPQVAAQPINPLSRPPLDLYKGVRADQHGIDRHHQ